MRVEPRPAPPPAGMREARWLDSGALAGDANMAIDEALLAGALDRPTVRVYAWREATVSLGRFQGAASVPEDLSHHPLVRRCSGGGAILHRDELTYCVALPTRWVTPRGRGVRESFARIHDAVALALVDLGVALDGAAYAGASTEAVVGAAAATPGAATAAEVSDLAFLCYQRRSPTDLTVGGRKLVGSAQRRRGEALLQHGSIPLGAAASAPGATSLALVLGRPVAYREVAEALARAFASGLGLAWRSAEPHPQAGAGPLDDT